MPDRIKAYKLKAYTLKAAVAFMEWWGRLLFFNLESPPAGGEILGVPYDTVQRRKQSVDIFVPRSAPPYPVLIYFHGSGFHVSDKKTYRRISRCFADRGYLVFNANYRLAPSCGFPGQISDVGKAVRWAYDHAAEYGGDNARLFLAGDSAGAQFSATYASALGKPELLDELSIEDPVPAASLRGLLLFYGAFDFATVVATGFPFGPLLVRGFLGEDSEQYRRRADAASPARHITKDFPPCYLASGGWDPMHTESQAFDRILSEAGVPHRTRIFPRTLKYLDGNHAYLIFPFSRCTRISLRESIEFLKGLS